MILRKFLTTFLFFVFLFAVKSVVANGVFANSIEGYFDNRAGAITVNVVVNYYDSSGTNIGFMGPVAILPGYKSYITKTDTSNPKNPPYRITWSTSCDSGSVGNIVDNGGKFIFSDRDVHCTKVNAQVHIKSASCPETTGTITWEVINIGDGGANIEYFRVYRSLGQPESDPNPITQAYLSSQNEYTLDLGTLSAGNWNLRVKAFDNPPGTDTDVADAVVSCGGGLTAARGLASNLTCVGVSANRVDLTWAPASPGTFTYEVQTNVGSDPGYGGNWQGTTYTPNPNTYTFVSVSAGFLDSTTYYWRVKATRTSDGIVVYSSSASFTTASCVSNIVGPNNHYNYGGTGYTHAKICAPSTVDNDYNVNDENWGARDANLPNRVFFQWYRGTYTQITEEYIEVSTDPNFFSGVLSFQHTTAVDSVGAKVVTYDFADNTTYYWRARAKMSDNNTYYSQVKTFYSPSSDNTGTSYFDPGCLDAGFSTGHPVALRTVSSYCWGNQQMAALRWALGTRPTSAGQDSATNMYVRITGNGANVTQLTAGYNLEFPTSLTPGLSYNFFVYISPWSAEPSNTIVTVAANCGSVDTNAPVGLDSIPTMACVSGKPSITFQWKDKSSSETGYQLDVSTEAFSGDATTKNSNMWGRKVTTAVAGVNSVTTFVWSDTTPLDYGDANVSDLTAANDRIPLEGTLYYWRIRAVIGSTNSAFKYPDGANDDIDAVGTFYPPGSPFESIVCSPKYELSLNAAEGKGAGFNSWNKLKFTSGELATLKVRIVNNDYPGVSESPPTKLHFYPTGVGVPSCTASPDPPPPAGGGFELQVPAIGRGAFKDVDLSFPVGSTSGTFVAQAYVVPTCAYSTGGTEYLNKWANNKTATGFSYSVDLDKYFTSTGGDVGAVGSIHVGVDSANAARCAGCISEYQSDYLLAGSILPAYGDPFYASVRDVPSSGFRMDGYNERLIDGAPYDYFYRFWKSTLPSWDECNGGVVPGGPPVTGDGDPTNAVGYTLNGLVKCANATGGDVVIGGEIKITGQAVVFVDGDLDIRGNIYVTGENGIVFVVRGNIYSNYLNENGVSRIVTRLDGIYVAQDTFYDNGQPVGGIAEVYCCFGENVFSLRVNGAVYAKKLDLSRYYADIDYSKQYPADMFNFDPKYYIILQDLLGTQAVAWREAAP